MNLDIPKNPDALINELGYGVTDRASDLLCSLVEPNFLAILLTDNNCSRGIVLPSAFKSKENFCHRFKYEWSPDIQKCMSDGAIRILVKLKGITSYQLDLGACCARCLGKIGSLFTR